MSFGIIAILFGYFNWPVKNNNHDAELGMTFSNKYSYSIGLDWKANYLAMLDDLKMKKIRIPVYWDLVEAQKGEYDFSDVDWQLDEARKRDAEIILAIGQKTPRWPECNIPEWAMESDEIRKENLRKFIAVVVERYKNDPVVKYWQVENEPFLRFGICPAPDAELLDSEIAIVRQADSSRKIITTDSGELSLWIQAAKRGDVFGTDAVNGFDPEIGRMRPKFSDLTPVYPDVRFRLEHGADFVTARVIDLEQAQAGDIGTHDITLMLGLLYHLENPVRALRLARAVTRKALDLETQVVPHMTAMVDWGSYAFQRRMVGVFGIVDEIGEEHAPEAGVGGICLAPSIESLEWLLRKVGFASVERLVPPAGGNEQHVGEKRAMFAAYVD